jgi:hypothetical protein
VESVNSWEKGEGWSQVKALIELAREEEASEWTAARRQRILHGVLERMEKDRERRRVTRAFAAGASTVLLAGLLLRLVSGVSPWLVRSAPELAGKQVSPRLAAE